MASAPHEALVKAIASGLEDVDRILRHQITERLLHCGVHTNLIMDGGSLSIIPDVAQIVTTLNIPTTESVLVIGEVTMSQTRNNLLRKLKDMVKAYPDVQMLIIAGIEEKTPYHAPRCWASAWDNLCSDASVRSRDTFLTNASMPQSLNKPTEIVVEGHTWCAISNIHFEVWVRGNGPIDIDTSDQNLTARGVSLVTFQLAHD